MENIQTAVKAKTPLRDIVFYSFGEGANSMALNSIMNFAMLYFTKVLGLGPKYASMALAITIFFDAITDPLMGHISDNTRSRFGRRHLYILIGGLALAASSFFFWSIPDVFKSPKLLFWYILVINLIVRTSSTVYGIPYVALGFEICTSYEERSRLQSVRLFFNQIFNFLGGALAWVLFFQDEIRSDGTRIDGSTIASNYYHAGISLAIASAITILLCVFFTRRYVTDTRNEQVHNDLSSFMRDFIDTISDRYALCVISTFTLATFGFFLVSQIQMFTYVDFMKLTAMQKTCVHGAGMILFGLGSLLQSYLVHRFDKKPTAYIAVAICVLSNVVLMILFIGNILPPEVSWIISDKLPILGGFKLPISVLMFGMFQALWWGGCGILVPLSSSMIADVSEINRMKTGQLKDGSYAAVFSFIIKAAVTVGFFLNGLLLDWAGFIQGDNVVQTAATTRIIAMLTFACGPVFMLMSVPIIFFYPVNRIVMENVKAKLANQNKQRSP